MNYTPITPMKIDVHINAICLHGKVRAFASITLADCFVIRGSEDNRNLCRSVCRYAKQQDGKWRIQRYLFSCSERTS